MCVIELIFFSLTLQSTWKSLIESRTPHDSFASSHPSGSFGRGLEQHLASQHITHGRHWPLGDKSKLLKAIAHLLGSEVGLGETSLPRALVASLPRALVAAAQQSARGGQKPQPQSLPNPKAKQEPASQSKVHEQLGAAAAPSTCLCRGTPWCSLWQGQATFAQSWQ